MSVPLFWLIVTATLLPATTLLDVIESDALPAAAALPLSMLANNATLLKVDTKIFFILILIHLRSLV